MHAYLNSGFLYVVDVPVTEENKKLLQNVVAMLRSYDIGERQVETGKIGGFRAKSQRYELWAMIGHKHAGEASQEMILESVEKVLGLAA